jgi:MFS family permease
VGVVEGVADGSSAVVKLFSGWYSDRIGWRRHLATGGYVGTVVGFGLVAVVTAWPQVILARAVAWVVRGARQPIRNALLAASVRRVDLGKAFGFHEAMDTVGALLGPTAAFLLLATGHGFREVFWLAIVPGIAAVLLFGLLPRDPRPKPSGARPAWEPLPRDYWKLIAAVALFGVGDFATAFFTLRAAEMLKPELSAPAATTGAVAFYLVQNLVGSLASFPGGWLADRLGKVYLLAVGYLSFVVACVVALAGHGPVAVALLAIPVGLRSPLVNATESSLTSSLVTDRLQGTAFGVLNAVNGAGDLVSSLAVGALWSAFGGPAGLLFGGALGLAGAMLLLALGPGGRDKAVAPG